MVSLSRPTCRYAMSVLDPSRHIAPPQDIGRERGIAEIDEQPCVAEGDTCDLIPKSSCRFSVIHKAAEETVMC